jgi:hypothetical protein
VISDSLARAMTQRKARAGLAIAIIRLPPLREKEGLENIVHFGFGEEECQTAKGEIKYPNLRASTLLLRQNGRLILGINSGPHGGKSSTLG